MITIVAAGLTDVGRMRAENQDCFGDFENEPSAVRVGRLSLVADGVGGHRGGKVASRMAVDALAEAYHRERPATSLETAPTIEERLVSAFQEANRRIYLKAEQDPALQGMASTCTALVLYAGRAFAAHLGDSRAYLVRGGSIRLLTRDHSFVQTQIDAGLLTAEEARTHVERNVITRSLGFEPEVEPEILRPPVAIQAGDRFVLSTDGLHGLLTDEEIAEPVLRLPPAEACRRLVAEANDRGGPDNITVVVLRIDEV